jgi:hypothetical protein
MQTQPAFGFKELFTHIVGDMAKALCERDGETKSQQILRSQAAARMIMSFLPRDAIEAMLAGHCVMFHELITDSIRETLRGELDSTRRATRSTIVAMDKAFGNNLTRLERYQARPSEGRRDAPEVEARGGMDMADRTPRPATQAPDPEPAVPVQTSQAEPRDVPAQTEADSLAVRHPDATLLFHPSPEVIAACRANPEAMAALEAGDPEAFARAMGLDMPNEESLAAATCTGTLLERQALGLWAADRAASNPAA